MNQRRSSYFVYMLFFIAIAALIFVTLSENPDRTDNYTINELADDLRNNRIERIEDTENRLRIYKKDSDRVESRSYETDDR